MRFTVLTADASRMVIEFDISELSLREVEGLKKDLLRKVKESQGEGAIVYDEHHQVLTDQPSLFPDLFPQTKSFPFHIPTPEELQEAEQDRKDLARFFDHLFHDYPTRGT